MNVNKKAAKGVFWSLIEGWGSQCISLIVFFLLARLLSPEAFGLVAMANVVLAFMNVFLDQGFAQALVQRQNLEPEHLDTAFWTNIAIGILLTILGIAGAEIIATWFDQPQLIPVLRCFSILFLISSLSNVQTAILEREFEFKAIAHRSLFGLFFSGIVGVTMALLGFGVWSLVGQKLTKEIIGSIVLWQASSWRPRLIFSKTHFDQLFNFGLSLYLLQFIAFFNNRGNDFLIGYFLGPIELGYYTIAHRILDIILTLLVNKTSQVSLPLFSRLQTDLPQFRKTFYTATQLASLISFPIFFGLAILAPEVVTLVFGEQWQASIPILQVLAFSGMIQAISFFKGHILVAMGKPSWRLWQSFLSITLNMIGFAIAFRFGIVALTVAYTVRRYLVFPVGQWAIHLLIHISWRTYLSQFLFPLAATAAMVITMIITKTATTTLSNSDLLIASTCTLVGAMTYTAILFLNPPEALIQFMQSAQSIVAKKIQK